jgi:hypothetical protein
MRICRDGTLLREFIPYGEQNIEVGLYPNPAVTITGVYRDGDQIVQKIRSVGGPAYSLTGMMGRARGVLGVEVIRDGACTEGWIRTRALTHLTIGLDNTDSPEDGATFALAIALLEHLGGFPGVFPICHQVAMLYPGVREKTAGNSCSAIELAVEPEIIEDISAEVARFVGDESASSAWGIAIRSGLRIPEKLRLFGLKTRKQEVSLAESMDVAARSSVILSGDEGTIGALAAVALSDLPPSLLLDPKRDP